VLFTKRGRGGGRGGEGGEGAGAGVSSMVGGGGRGETSAAKRLGIRTFVYQARRPFDRERLWKVLQVPTVFRMCSECVPNVCLMFFRSVTLSDGNNTLRYTRRPFEGERLCRVLPSK
jgi:hypothetical protein